MYQSMNFILFTSISNNLDSILLVRTYAIGIEIMNVWLILLISLSLSPHTLFWWCTICFLHSLRFFQHANPLPLPLALTYPAPAHSNIMHIGLYNLTAMTAFFLHAIYIFHADYTKHFIMRFIGKTETAYIVDNGLKSARVSTLRFKI